MSTNTGFSGVAWDSNFKYLFNCERLCTISIPLPPRTNEGLTSTGYPIFSAYFTTSSEFLAAAHSGIWIPFLSITLPHFSLSSAISILLTVDPKIFVGNFSCLIYSSMCAAKFTAVWPPSCNTIPYGFSKSNISKMASRSRGSKYNLSEASKSVETVSGLLFTTTASYPASLAAWTPWTVE